MLGRILLDCAKAADPATAVCRNLRRSISILQSHAQFNLAGRLGRRHLPECGRSEGRVRIAEIRVIHKIKELGAELKCSALAAFESSLDGDIAVEKSRR